VGSGYNIARLELNVDEMTVAVTSSSFEGGQSRLSLSQQWTFDHAGSYVVSSVAYDIRGKMSDVATVNVIVEKREARVPTEPPSPVAPQADTTQTRSKDGMTMLYVPAGDFAMGTDYGYSDNEKPMHTVTLEAYWIDRTEVTNAQFRMCVEAGACQAPTTCDRGEPTYNDGAKTDHPVVCVDWNQALAYCEWAGVRLPTEAEWEKAARGTDGRKYPWGPVADCSKAQARECGGQTVPVGSKAAGASPYGALDMAGNVYEWVNDWYHRNYYDVSPDSNPPGPASGSDKVLRGGRWDSIWIDVRASNRIDHSPTERSHYIGFRCAASPGE
jgi:formylglycine-generating enzyme required for sulfatase activity